MEPVCRVRLRVGSHSDILGRAAQNKVMAAAAKTFQTISVPVIKLKIGIQHVQRPHDRNAMSSHKANNSSFASSVEDRSGLMRHR